MMAFYETYAALVQHLRAAHPSGSALTAAQHELLGSADAHLNLLNMQCNQAQRTRALIDDLQDLLATPEHLAAIVSGEARGSALLMAGIERVAEFAGEAAQLLAFHTTGHN